jgi:hypothetical protein
MMKNTPTSKFHKIAICTLFPSYLVHKDDGFIWVALQKHMYIINNNIGLKCQHLIQNPIQ